MRTSQGGADVEADVRKVIPGSPGTGGQGSPDKRQNRQPDAQRNSARNNTSGQTGTGNRQAASGGVGAGQAAANPPPLDCGTAADGVDLLCGFIPPAGQAAAGAGNTGTAAVPAVNPVVIARAAALRLPIPLPEAQVGPPPHVNEWNMVAVGYPLWLWTDGPDTHTATITQQGITLTLSATRRTTRFDLGDGTRVFCGRTTSWHPGVEPGAPSPTCGHVYKKPSPPGSTFAVTATTVWDITWTALGATGTLELERTGPPTNLPVGELHALRTR
ncbi:MAG: hypothetical protein Q4G46_02150 [Propionibacteriaceae bacterium]|nr:hypothetical protein [Propionibacteriaceae bacterium]